MLTLLLGVVLLWLFRRRVARLMMAAATSRCRSHRVVPGRSRQLAVRPSRWARRRPSTPCWPHVAGGAQRGSGDAPRDRSSERGRADIRRRGHVAELRAAGIEPNLNRILVMSWTWAWPTVLALGLVGW